MENLDLGKIEGQFGLMLREKANHDNYILICFNDLEKIVRYFQQFNEKTREEIKSKEMELKKYTLNSMLKIWKERLEDPSELNKEFINSRIKKIEKKLKKLEEEENDIYKRC